MTDEQILDAVVIDASRDLAAVAVFLDLRGLDWCIIGGHATDSHVPPAIYSDRLDVAVDAENLVFLLTDLAEEGFRVQQHEQIAHVERPGDGHRLRVQLFHGPQFRGMPARASRRAVLGCSLPVANLADVVAGLLVQRADPAQGWHAQGKAELDLLRLAEQHPAQVDDLLPGDLRARAEADRQHATAHSGGDGWG